MTETTTIAPEYNTNSTGAPPPAAAAAANTKELDENKADITQPAGNKPDPNAAQKKKPVNKQFLYAHNNGLTHYHNKDGKKVITAAPDTSTSFMDAISEFFSLLMLLFKGDFETFQFRTHKWRDDYVDPIMRGESDFTPQQQRTIQRMDRDLKELEQKVTFDPNMPRTQRLLMLADQEPVQRLLRLIRKNDGGGHNSYNTGNGSIEPTYNGKKATQCTLTEIKAMQAKGWGGASSAIGAYQLMPGTRDEAIKRLGLDPDTTIFNKQTQDLIGMDLLEHRGLSHFIEGKMSLETFMDNLAKEWAILPKDMSGKTHYGGTANNPHKAPDGLAEEVYSTLKGINPNG